MDAPSAKRIWKGWDQESSEVRRKGCPHKLQAKCGQRGVSNGSVSVADDKRDSRTGCMTKIAKDGVGIDLSARKGIYVRSARRNGQGRSQRSN